MVVKYPFHPLAGLICVKMSGENCPVCIKDGSCQMLRLCQINLDEAILICDNDQCTYPLGVQSAQNVLQSRKPKVDFTRDHNAVNYPVKPIVCSGKTLPVKPGYKINAIGSHNIMRAKSSAFKPYPSPANKHKPFVSNVETHRHMPSVSTVKVEANNNILKTDSLRHTTTSSVKPGATNRNLNHNTTASLSSVEAALVMLCNSKTLKNHVSSSPHHSVLKSLLPIGRSDNIKLTVNLSWTHKDLKGVLLWLLAQDKTVHKKCTVQYTTEISCSSCGAHKSNRHASPVVEVCGKSDTIYLSSASYVTRCTVCYAAGVCCVRFSSVPQSLIVHYQKGIEKFDSGHMTDAINGSNYHVTELLEMSGSPLQHIVWCRNTDGIWSRHSSMNSSVIHNQPILNNTKNVMVVWQKVSDTALHSSPHLKADHTTIKKQSPNISMLNLMSSKREFAGKMSDARAHVFKAQRTVLSAPSSLAGSPVIFQKSPPGVTSCRTSQGSFAKMKESMKKGANLPTKLHSFDKMKQSSATSTGKSMRKSSSFNLFASKSSYVESVTRLLKKTQSPSDSCSLSKSEQFEGYIPKVVKLRSMCSSTSSSRSISPFGLLRSNQNQSFSANIERENKDEVSPKKSVQFQTYNEQVESRKRTTDSILTNVKKPKISTADDNTSENVCNALCRDTNSSQQLKVENTSRRLSDESQKSLESDTRSIENDVLKDLYSALQLPECGVDTAFSQFDGTELDDLFAETNPSDNILDANIHLNDKQADIKSDLFFAGFDTFLDDVVNKK